MSRLAATVERDEFFVDGSWIRPSTSERITVISPNTEAVLGSVPEGREADMDKAVSSARRAFDDPTGWSHWGPSQRATVLRRFADAMESRGSAIAQAVSAQNGMPISFAAGAEANGPALFLRYYADLVDGAHREDRRNGLFGKAALVTREPLGVVACIVPWNVPQAITAGVVAPALAAGCTVVVKPATETVLDAYLLAEAALEAGLPPGVLNIVPAGREMGAYLVAHAAVDKVSFTGSTAAGRHVGEVCGRLLRPVTLELGGKSAALILDDAPIDSLRDSLFAATFANNGQICHANTRILASRHAYRRVLDTVSDLASSLTVGNSLDPAVEVGPLVSQRQRDRVEGYVEKGRAEGARITVGGQRPAGLFRGWFVAPTVFADVDNSSTIAQEEIFGPVVCVIPFTDEDDAVRIANDSNYGLAGSVWSSDLARAEALARRIVTGSVGINSYAPDPVAPFGGVKESGVGRSFGPEGLANYQSTKSIYLDHP